MLAAGGLLVLLQEAFHHREEVGTAALLRLLCRQPIQPFLHGFAFALNINTPPCELGRQTGILPFLANGKAQLTVWHDHNGGLDRASFIQQYTVDLGRAE